MAFTYIAEAAPAEVVAQLAAFFQLQQQRQVD